MLKVGLTGGIASGKTTVAEMFARLGCRVLFADRIAHQLMQLGQPAYEEIVRTFGREVLAADGRINRARLGALVFADAQQRAELNRIVHPRVIEEIEKEFARTAGAAPHANAMFEAALLVEARYHRRLDKLIVTWCTPEQQRERLLAKGLTPAEADQRLAAQLPSEEKRRLADYVIDCSGPLAATEKQVAEVFAALQRLAHAAAS
ncbi:MAG: dephospho-CoA kinase [Acidobacteria bacterium]|nr:dephospho-CoA kinase [Acidobacteriota bacterium]